MSGEISTIQSLKAVDAWIDVINANINGGVRTAFKSSRLKFSGSNTDIQHVSNATSLPLQFAEPSLTTANTVIDFTQGAITASTENTHLAIQGDGWFMVVEPSSVNPDGTMAAATSRTKILLTRDGEFHTDKNGLLVTSYGYYLITGATSGGGLAYSSASFGVTFPVRAVYNNLDVTTPATVATQAIRLSDFIEKATFIPTGTILADGTSTLPSTTRPLINVYGGLQLLQYSNYGSTAFDIGYVYTSGQIRPGLGIGGQANGNVLGKSLEASNSSMTQSVPELSLAQKLFSALTKVLQTKQTNVDGVLNLVR